MRIIAGSARSRIIQAPAGRDTRPTLDRVRENLFNILQHRTADAAVLDLFAGSGALSLEAISRGASSAVLCDHDRQAIRCIRQNGEALGFLPRMRIMSCDWQQAVQALRQELAQFDLVFLDPPYAMQDLRSVTQALLPLLHADSLVVLEHDVRSTPVISGGYQEKDSRKYGIVGIKIYQPEQEAQHE